jgi:hypothetical protein
MRNRLALQTGNSERETDSRFRAGRDQVESSDTRSLIRFI